jgi:hypothetical protein
VPLVIHTSRARSAAEAAPAQALLQPGTESDPTEDLFPEARRRERRRRLIAAAVVIVVIAAAIALASSFGNSSRPAGLVSKATASSPVVNARAFAHEGLLAFMSDRKLYVLDGSTGALRQAGRTATGAEEPTFSADGKWLAYIAAGAETHDELGYATAPYAPSSGPLVISSADGSAARRIARVGEISSVEWSPTSDQLLVVSGSGPYFGSAVWIVSASGSARRLYSGDESVYGAVWSPNGTQVALAIQPQRGDGPTTVETLPAAGGAPRVWSQPTAQNEQWLVPFGWWKDQGIALWTGGGGTAPGGDGSNDGATLMIESSPGAPLRSLGRTPPVAMTPVVASSTGWLAVGEGGNRVAMSKKSIETCAPVSDRCATVPEPSSVTAYDAVWSPDGSELAFIEAPSHTGIDFSLSAVRAWYASGEVELLAAGQSQATVVPHTLGATAPQWSSSGDGLMYIANDAVYLVRKPGDTPVRIAGPLLPPKEWTSTYYGGIDWRFMFAWTGR